MKVWLTFFALFLSGCANLNMHPDTGISATNQHLSEQAPLSPEANQHLNEIAIINDFKLSGRIGIQAKGHGLSGPIEWLHTEKIDDIDLYSPLGSKVAQINKTEAGVSLTNKEGKVYTAENTESLVQSTLGLQIPFNHLSDWIVGRPAKGIASNFSWDSLGRLSKLTQNGWEISYMEYQPQAQYKLPSKINLRNEKMNVRLVVENWELPAATSDQQTN